MIDSNQYPVFDENPAIGDDPVDCFVHDQDEHYDENDYKGDEIIPKAPAKITRVEICDWVESLIATTTAVFLLMTFAVRVNQVHGSSMQPTLHEGDRLIITPIYGEPRHGDIIVLSADHLPNSQTGELGELIVKRVIGLPGDEINICKDSGEVYRNGELLTEHYIAEKIRAEKVGNQTYPIVVEANKVFVMGDNRNYSTDSRIVSATGAGYYVGYVDYGEIIGRAVLRVYPFEDFGGLG